MADEQARDRPGDDGPGATSRSANQPHPSDPDLVPPSPAHADGPGAATGEPDHPGGPQQGRATTAEQEQVGAPERSVPDLPPAPGTSAGFPPTEGVHTPDAGPGGRDFDTADRPTPGRTGQSGHP